MTKQESDEIVTKGKLYAIKMKEDLTKKANYLLLRLACFLPLAWQQEKTRVILDSKSFKANRENKKSES